MAFTLAQLDALDAAIATGTTQVTYGNKIVMFKSTKEMLEVRNLMIKELGLGVDNNGGRKYGEFNKGINNSCDEQDRRFYSDL